MNDLDLSSLHFIDLEFVARRKILSLPVWHGARWHAFLREASQGLSFNLEDAVLSCRPERNGTLPIQQGERMVLHLLVTSTAIPHLPDLLQALSFCQGAGEFSSRALELLNARDAISGKLVWLPLQGWLEDPTLFHSDFLNAQAAMLASMDEWTLQLLSPLRLPLPPGHPARGCELDKYARPEFLATAAGLQWLLQKLRFCYFDHLLPVANLVPAQNHHLVWDDMRYNEKRKLW